MVLCLGVVLNWVRSCPLHHMLFRGRRSKWAKAGVVLVLYRPDNEFFLKTPWDDTSFLGLAGVSVVIWVSIWHHLTPCGGLRWVKGFWRLLVPESTRWSQHFQFQHAFFSLKLWFSLSFCSYYFSDSLHGSAEVWAVWCWCITLGYLNCFEPNMASSAHGALYCVLVLA